VWDKKCVVALLVRLSLYRLVRTAGPTVQYCDDMPEFKEFWIDVFEFREKMMCLRDHRFFLVRTKKRDLTHSFPLPRLTRPPFIFMISGLLYNICIVYVMYVLQQKSLEYRKSFLFILILIFYPNVTNVHHAHATRRT
jgi:hypothetical protein